MADGVFGVEIVTPEQSLFAGGATSIVLATSEGALTVLDGHTPLVGDVVHCEVKVEQAEGTLVRLAVHGGFLQVDTSPGAAEGLAEGDGPLPGSVHPGDRAGRRGRAGLGDRRAPGRGGPRARRRSGSASWGRAGARPPRTSTRTWSWPMPRERWRGPSCGWPWPPTTPPSAFAAAGPCPPPARRDQSNEIERVLGQLGQGVAGVDFAQRPRLGAHDQRLRGGPELVVLHALQQLAVGDARGGEEAVVPLDEVVGRQHGVERVPGLEGGGPLLLVARVEPALEFRAHALERRGGDHALGRAPDAEEDVGPGAGPTGGDGARPRPRRR